MHCQKELMNETSGIYVHVHYYYLHTIGNAKSKSSNKYDIHVSLWMSTCKLVYLQAYNHIYLDVGQRNCTSSVFNLNKSLKFDQYVYRFIIFNWRLYSYTCTMVKQSTESHESLNINIWWGAGSKGRQGQIWFVPWPGGHVGFWPCVCQRWQGLSRVVGLRVPLVGAPPSFLGLTSPSG